MRSRRRIVALATVLLALLAVAGAAAAAPGPSFVTGYSRARLTLHAQRAFWTTSSRAARTVDPIGPFTLSGTVLDYDGAPETEAEVFWGWMQDPGSSWWDGTATVGTTGYVGRRRAPSQFPAVTSVPGDDWLSAVSWDEYGLPGARHLGQRLLGAAAATSSVLVAYAWRRRATVAAPTSWSGTGDAGEVGRDERVPAALSRLLRRSPGAGLRDRRDPGGGLPGSGRARRGLGQPGLRAGARAGGQARPPVTLEFDWDDAVRGRLAGPMCTRSGPAGSGVTFVIDDWPAGMQVSFRGFSFADGRTTGSHPVVTPQGPRPDVSRAARHPGGRGRRAISTPSRPTAQTTRGRSSTCTTTTWSAISAPPAA